MITGSPPNQKVPSIKFHYITEGEKVVAAMEEDAGDEEPTLRAIQYI